MDKYEVRLKEVYKKYNKMISRMEYMIKDSALKNKEDIAKILFNEINFKNIKKS